MFDLLQMKGSARDQSVSIVCQQVPHMSGTSYCSGQSLIKPVPIHALIFNYFIVSYLTYIMQYTNLDQAYWVRTTENTGKNIQILICDTETQDKVLTFAHIKYPVFRFRFLPVVMTWEECCMFFNNNVATGTIKPHLLLSANVTNSAL